MPERPNALTIGRYWRDRDGTLWLQEYTNGVIVTFLRGDDPFNDRLIEIPESERFLDWKLMEEPLLETLAREREETFHPTAAIASQATTEGA